MSRDAQIEELKKLYNIVGFREQAEVAKAIFMRYERLLERQEYGKSRRYSKDPPKSNMDKIRGVVKCTCGFLKRQVPLLAHSTWCKHRKNEEKYL